MKQRLMIALYSIKPIYSDQIISGSKTFELRKRMPANKLDYILIYSSSPVSKIVGFAEVKDVYKNSLTTTWKHVSKNAGISKNDYLEYFNGCSDAYAIELGAVKKFIRPFDIAELHPDRVPPQSFSYVDQKDFKRIIKRKTEIV